MQGGHNGLLLTLRRRGLPGLWTPSEIARLRARKSKQEEGDVPRHCATLIHAESLGSPERNAGAELAGVFRIDQGFGLSAAASERVALPRLAGLG